MSASGYWLSWSGACASVAAANPIEATTPARSAMTLRMSRRLFTHSGWLSIGFPAIQRRMGYHPPRHHQSVTDEEQKRGTTHQAWIRQGLQCIGGGTGTDGRHHPGPGPGA